MSSNEIRLSDGSIWTYQDFVNYYVSRPSSGTLSPISVDMTWYMNEGPGRFYQPGMFGVVREVFLRQDLPPGTYDLTDLAGGTRSPALSATLSNYFTDPSIGGDYFTRALVFGNESAKISGSVVVGADGSKTFQNIQIRPFDTDFDFTPNTGNKILELARSIGSRIYDPDHVGVSYDIEYRGSGRVYDPFDAAQLLTALGDNLAAPRELTGAYAGVLPSSAVPPLSPDLSAVFAIPTVDFETTFSQTFTGSYGDILRLLDAVGGGSIEPQTQYLSNTDNGLSS